jgi:hypothetical protein
MSWTMGLAMGRRPTARLLALAALLCLLVTGCAQRESGANDNRPGGFYGGVSGGMTRP